MAGYALKPGIIKEKPKLISQLVEIMLKEIKAWINSPEYNIDLTNEMNNVFSEFSGRMMF